MLRCSGLPCRCCVVLSLFLVFPPWVISQIQNGQFAGVIEDPTGANVANARIVIKNLETGYELVVHSNEFGAYTAQELTVGHYKLTVEAAGFKTAITSSVELNAGTVARVDFKLQIGERQETVDVADAAVMINSENSRLAQTVDSTQVANLPLNGRNVYDLIQYAPGATNMRGTMFENGANTVVNGVRENFNGFVINGVSNKGLSGGPVNQPIEDTVQEFQLLTLNNSAEFGNSAGAITNLVTKSGTNDSPREWLGILSQRCARCQSVFRQPFCGPCAAPENAAAPEPIRGNGRRADHQEKAVLFCGLSRGQVYHLQPGTSAGGVLSVPAIRDLDLPWFHFQPLVFQLCSCQFGQPGFYAP